MIEAEDRNRQRLLHIFKACKTIGEYVAKMSREQFLDDDRTRDAVIYQLIIIGEAVTHVDKEMLDSYDYPWYKVRAFRNYAAHEYFNIQLWTVWEIVDKHVPELGKIVETILENEF